MYGYSERVNLTVSQVLQKVSQEQIFEWILGKKVVLNERIYKSPFRVDKSPGCEINKINGKLYFKDFADSKLPRDCFNMVMDFYSVGLRQAIEMIVNKFELPTDINLYEEDTSIFNKVSQKKGKSDIKYQTRKWDKRDKLYWGQFLITISNLQEDNVYPLRTFSFLSKKHNYSRITISPYDITYCIYDDEDGIKIYRPLAPEGTRRFTSSINVDSIGNLSNIDLFGYDLLITKSYKDHRVCRNILGRKNVIWLQNEGMIPTEDVIRDLCFRFEVITLLFDNDQPGVEAAYKVAKAFNDIKPGIVRILFLPLTIDERFRYKDPGELVKREGRQESKNILNNIGIYGDNASDYS